MKTLKDVLASVVDLTDDQYAVLEQHVVLKKTPKGTKKWEFVEVDTMPAKTPLQMQQAYHAIEGEGAVNMETWAKLLADVDGFRTAQPVERIIAFYKKRMIDEGLIREVM